MNPQTPELIALYRIAEDGEEDQLAGWAMVLPDTENVVAYVPGTDDVNTGLLQEFRSRDSAAFMLSYADLYPVGDWSEPPDDLP
jgi:hypothetical protein